jgi:hypothetical protein
LTVEIPVHHDHRPDTGRAHVDVGNEEAREACVEMLLAVVIVVVVVVVVVARTRGTTKVHSHDGQ